MTIANSLTYALAFMIKSSMAINYFGEEKNETTTVSTSSDLFTPTLLWYGIETNL